MNATLASTVQVPADEHVLLIGRPPMGEFLGFMKQQTLEGNTVEVGALADHWRAANRRIRELEAIEAGFADGVPVVELPTALSARAAEILGSALVRRNFGITRNEIVLVEIDRLVVHQKSVNLEYARELQATLPAEPSADDLLDFALPLDRRYDPPTRVGPIGPGAWAMLSPSTDFRVLDTVLLDPAQVSGLNLSGAPMHVVAAVIGYGSNFVTAMRVKGRLILRNGSHRTYAMRAAGVTHAPVLIQDIPEGEENEHLPPEVQQHADRYLRDPRPPLVRDYFDEEMRLVVHVPRKAKQVRAFVQCEESYAPGM